MSSPASLWNSAPLFWKTYALAVLFVGGIIAVGELSEGWWEALLGVEQMESGGLGAADLDRGCSGSHGCGVSVSEQTVHGNGFPSDGEHDSSCCGGYGAYA